MFCGSVVGIPSEIISPKKVAELHPLLNVHDLVGAMHVPEDAVVSSADVALALASAASQNGEWVFLFICLFVFVVTIICMDLERRGYLREHIMVGNTTSTGMEKASSLGYSAFLF